MTEQERVLKEKEVSQKGLLQFRPFDEYVRSALINNEIIFGAAKNFNDPYDCNLPINLDNVSIDLIKEYLRIANKKYLLSEVELEKKVKEYFENKIKLEKIIRGIINNYRRFSCFQVASLIDTHRDILFWANYADKHKGICLKFNGDLSEASKHYTISQDESIDSYPIDYVCVIPVFNYLIYRISKEQSGCKYARKLYGYSPSEYFFTIKNDRWKHENEVRFIFKSPDDSPIMDAYKNIKFNPKMLEQIYIGCNASRSTVDEVFKIMHLPKYSNVDVIKLVRDKKEFKLIEERLK